jgi:hypothetical protein
MKHLKSFKLFEAQQGYQKVQIGYQKKENSYKTFQTGYKKKGSELEDNVLNTDLSKRQFDNFYHLIPSTIINDVKENGLQIKYSKQHKFEPGIYLASSLYVAKQYSFLDEYREDYYIVEIPFNNLEEEYMKPDDYELFDLIDDEYPQILDDLGLERTWDNQKLVWQSINYKESLYICEQILYTKDILPSQFSNIYHKNELD